MRADEDDMAARLAYETKFELDKEEETRLAAKSALKAYLLQNEANKAIRQQVGTTSCKMVTFKKL